MNTETSTALRETWVDGTLGSRFRRHSRTFGLPRSYLRRRNSRFPKGAHVSVPRRNPPRVSDRTAPTWRDTGWGGVVWSDPFLLRSPPRTPESSGLTSSTSGHGPGVSTLGKDRNSLLSRHLNLRRYDPVYCVVTRIISQFGAPSSLSGRAYRTYLSSVSRRCLLV